MSVPCSSPYSPDRGCAVRTGGKSRGAVAPAPHTEMACQPCSPSLTESPLETGVQAIQPSPYAPCPAPNRPAAAPGFG